MMTVRSIQSDWSVIVRNMLPAGGDWWMGELALSANSHCRKSLIITNQQKWDLPKPVPSAAISSSAIIMQSEILTSVEQWDKFKSRLTDICIVKSDYAS